MELVGEEDMDKVWQEWGKEKRETSGGESAYKVIRWPPPTLLSRWLPAGGTRVALAKRRMREFVSPG
jgi:hypothetical protein